MTTTDERMQANRRAIRQAARALLKTMPYNAIRQVDVAQAAKLSRATVQRTYPVLDSLYLRLYRADFKRWSAAFATALTAADPDATAQLVAVTLRREVTLLTLHPLIYSLIVPRAATKVTAPFIHATLQALFENGQRIDRAFPRARRGNGSDVIMAVLDRLGNTYHTQRLSQSLKVLQPDYYRDLTSRTVSSVVMTATALRPKSYHGPV